MLGTVDSSCVCSSFYISNIVGNLILLQVDSAELRLGDGDEGIVDDKAVLPSIWSAEYLYTLV